MDKQSCYASAKTSSGEGMGVLRTESAAVDSPEFIRKKESGLLVDENEEPDEKRPQPEGIHPG